jgi:hypothetical protein
MCEPLRFLVEITPDERTHWTEHHDEKLLCDLSLIVGQIVRIHSSGSMPDINVEQLSTKGKVASARSPK